MQYKGYSYNIAVIGDPEAGISGLLSRYTGNDAPISASAKTEKSITVPSEEGDLAIHQYLRNQSGTEGNLKYKDAQGIIVAVDVTNPGSLESAKKWLQEVNIYARQVPCMLVGINTGKESQSEFGLSVNIHAQKSGVAYVECSLATGQNIDKVFDTLTQQILHAHGINKNGHQARLESAQERYQRQAEKLRKTLAENSTLPKSIKKEAKSILEKAEKNLSSKSKIALQQKDIDRLESTLTATVDCLAEGFYKAQEGKYTANRLSNKQALYDINDELRIALRENPEMSASWKIKFHLLQGQCFEETGSLLSAKEKYEGAVNDVISIEAVAKSQESGKLLEQARGRVKRINQRIARNSSMGQVEGSDLSSSLSSSSSSLSSASQPSPLLPDDEPPAVPTPFGSHRFTPIRAESTPSSLPPLPQAPAAPPRPPRSGSHVEAVSSPLRPLPPVPGSQKAPALPPRPGTSWQEKESQRAGNPSTALGK